MGQSERKVYLFGRPEGQKMQVELLLTASVEELLGIGGLHLILNLSRKARMLGICMVTFR
jgi:hypothetical protein